MSVRATRLDNGLTVLSDTMEHVKTVSLGVWLRAGARDESEAQNGIAHMLEHMAFKGTHRRNAQQIAEDMERAGGEMNAATGLEGTAYYARVLGEDVGLGLDILSDIIVDPVFAIEELEREREVILEEITAADDTPDDLVFDLFHEAAFPGQPLGRPILGRPERVSEFSADDLALFRTANYAGSRMVLAAAGAVDHDWLVEGAGELLAGFPEKKPPNWPLAKFEGGVCLASKPIGQAHIVLGFAAPGYRDEEIYAVQVLAMILGGGVSSRLFQEVREKRGLSYAIQSFASPFEDAGLIGVYAATGPRKVGDLVAVVADQLQSVGEDLSEDEVLRARAQLKAGLVTSLESSAARADQIARQQLVFGRPLPVEETIAKVDAVDVHAVKMLAQRLFSRQRPALGAVGALDFLDPFDKIADRFS